MVLTTPLALLVEHSSAIREVAGSIPVRVQLPFFLSYFTTIATANFTPQTPYKLQKFEMVATLLCKLWVSSFQVSQKS